jgi:putative molybdopterin biosynthesis protein
MQFMTTSEVAEYLRLKERKLYELVAEGAIPCTKVTGRWLFPKAEIDRWLAASLVRPGGMPVAEPPPIVGGSHDPLLEWALRESGCGLASLPEGSERGLERLQDGGCLAAAIHLHALDAGVDANVATLSAGQQRDLVLIGLLCREQGLLVPNGNPRGLQSIRDVIGKRARFAMRPAGAGAQLLLLALVHREGLAEQPVSGPSCPTGPDVAQAIRAGRADCGIATRSVANAAGVGFVPLVWERFDLALRQRDYFRQPLQTLFGFVRGPAFKARADELGGYDVADAGSVRYAP